MSSEKWYFTALASCEPTPRSRQRRGRCSRTLLVFFFCTCLLLVPVLLIGCTRGGPNRSHPIAAFASRERRSAVALEVNGGGGNVVKSKTGTAVPQRPPRVEIPSRMEGRTTPEKPEQLPGFTVTHRTYTPDELTALYGNFTIVYTFVNGSDPNHFYRKRMVVECKKNVIRKEKQWYRDAEQFYGLPNSSTEDPFTDSFDLPINEAFEKWVMGKCLPRYLQNQRLRTNRDPWRLTRLNAVGAGDNRDREVDELRHSFRSVEEHMGWHQGRVVIVTPGHYPGWIDGAKNFLANRCGGAAVHGRSAERSYLRLTVIHQDAILPYGMKLTRDSNTVEQRLWRVKNITAVHLYYNDDYFVNRDVKITDIFNEYGGPIIRTEKRLIGAGKRGDNTIDWTKGALNSHLFSIIEVDENPQGYLPDSMIHMWTTERSSNDIIRDMRMPAPDNYRAIDTTFLYKPEPLPDTVREDTRNRRFVTHSPYVYCTNMFAFLETRYEREYASNSFYHRARHAQDLYLPFVYNAFAMERPWVGSPKFLPYLLQLREHTLGNADAPTVDVELNNYDGCGPATYLSGIPVSDCLFIKISNNLKRNGQSFKKLLHVNPLYFNLNAGYSSSEAGDMLREFIKKKYPTPIYLERGLEPISEEDRALPQLYGDLMKLPVIAVTSFEEGVCPMVRSLQFSLPDHTGVVVSAVARHGTDEERDKTLSELRTEMVHRYRSAVPAVACAYKDRVRALRSAVPAAQTRSDAMSESVLASIVDSALSELQANGTSAAAVPIPSVCGVAGGDGGDVRIRAIVLDGRSDVTDALSLRHAVTMPGQTLALEDFDVVPLADGSGDSVLVLARSASDAKAVHWIDGAAESDLLIAYPLPYADYEDLRAPLQWSNE